MLRNLFLISIVFILIVSCGGTHRAYEGSKLQEHQVAIVKVTSNWLVGYSGTLPRAIDGIPVSRVFSLEVLPGKHTVTVSYITPDYVAKSRGYAIEDRGKVTFIAKAGHTYLLKAEEDAYQKVKFWIEDITKK